MDGRDLLAGRYELRGVLGRGGMAEVRDGWDARLNRAVAVKLLHPAFTTDPELRRRFEDEARSAAALNHPNIVAVHDCGEHHGTPFIVMERLPGGTLADEIAAGPLPPPRVRSVLDDVLSALATAHAAGVLHRDVKPGNILIAPGRENTVKVADFGIAKTAGAAHTATGQIIGTMAYMSPDRIAGAPASVADDLYAVGIIGYEALTGRRPYQQENPAALLRAILDGPPPPIAAVHPDVDPALAAAIDRAMARDVRQRFADAEQMRDTLMMPLRPATKVLPDPFAPAAVPGAFAPSANYFVPPAPRRRLSRGRKLLLAAAALVVLVVVALALALDPSSTQAPQQVSTSTTTPAPTPTTTSPAPPPPAPVPVVEQPRPGKKHGEDGPGNGHRKH